MSADDCGFHLEIIEAITEDGDDPRLDGAFSDWVEQDARAGCVIIVIGPQYIEITVENAPPGLSLQEPAALAVEFLRDGHLKEGDTLHVCWDRLPVVMGPGFVCPHIPAKRSA